MLMIGLVTHQARSYPVQNTVVELVVHCRQAADMSVECSGCGSSKPVVVVRSAVGIADCTDFLQVDVVEQVG